MIRIRKQKSSYLTFWMVTAFFFGFNTNTDAQFNLVPNHSFEQYTNCPINSRNDQPDIWYRPDKRGAGYINACNNYGNGLSGVPIHFTTAGYGFQYAKTGDAYIGMFYLNGPGTNARNYYQVKLYDSLRKGRCYYVECFVNLSNQFRMASNNQSILLTNTPVYVDTMSPLGIQILPANPQITNHGNPIISDTLNWVKVSGVFTAQGGELYLTLGNFRYDNQTTYTVVNPGGGYTGAAYYVDDVSVIPLDSMPLKADAGKDTTIALGDSVFIGSLTNGLNNVQWYNAAGQLIDNTRPGFKVSPTATTFYVLQQTVCGYTSRDTVYVYVNPLPVRWINFTCSLLSPSPRGEGRGEAVALHWQTANEQNVSHFIIQRSANGREFENIDEVPAKNKPLNEYSYLDKAVSGLSSVGGRLYYRLLSLDNDGRKTYSEIRRVILGESSSPLTVYPNPASTTVGITYSTTGRASIEVYNSIGIKIHSATLSSNAGTLQLATAWWRRGIYHVILRENGKVIKSRQLIVAAP